MTIDLPRDKGIELTWLNRNVGLAEGLGKQFWRNTSAFTIRKQYVLHLSEKIALLFLDKFKYLVAL